MARLDRLGPAARRIAQIGAAIGREFSLRVGSAEAGEFAEETLQEALQRLVDAGLAFQRGMSAHRSVHVSSTRLCKMLHMHFLRGRDGNCIPGSPNVRGPLPYMMTVSPNSSLSITPKRGSSKNPSFIGAKPVQVRCPLGDGRSRRAI